MEELTKQELVGSILLPARTNSEWDECDAVLMQLDEEFAKKLLKRIEFAEKVEKQSEEEGLKSFSHIEFYGDLGQFVTAIDPSDWQTEEEDDPVIITEELVEQLELGKPQGRPGENVIRVSAGGIIQVAWGKHTGEEYWTSLLTKQFLTDYINGSLPA